MDGTWTDTRSDFSLDFGAVADEAPDLTSCGSDTDTVRPDGDDGTGSEADEITVTVAASAVPDWWYLRVLDADGTTIRSQWLPEGASASASLVWDARADDGLIVGNGDYMLSVSPADLSWNLGTSCTSTVTVDNRVVAL